MLTKSPAQAGLFSFRTSLIIQYLAQSARLSVTFSGLSPPEVSRHISTSLPDGTGLATLCGIHLNAPCAASSLKRRHQ
jgi:hypothetical protein